MNKALYKIVGNGVIITPKVKRELDGLYRGWPAAQQKLAPDCHSRRAGLVLDGCLC